MTMNVYAHVSLDNQRAALDLLNAQLVDASEGAPDCRCGQQPLSNDHDDWQRLL
jgi:hypothetical protein